MEAKAKARYLRVTPRKARRVIDLIRGRMAHASELVEEIGRHDLTVAEHPVHILYTDYSRSKGQSVLNSVNIVIDMLFR